MYTTRVSVSVLQYACTRARRHALASEYTCGWTRRHRPCLTSVPLSLARIWVIASTSLRPLERLFWRGWKGSDSAIVAPRTVFAVYRIRCAVHSTAKCKSTDEWKSFNDLLPFVVWLDHLLLSTSLSQHTSVDNIEILTLGYGIKR